MKTTKLPYLSAERDRHGKLRLYVRRNGRKIRIRSERGTPEFLVAYREALKSLNESPNFIAPRAGKCTPGTFGWLATCYMASDAFTNLVGDSKATRRLIIEQCLKEPIRAGSPEVMAGCSLKVLSSVHIKMLRDRKKNLPGAANNRRKYLSTMLGWAVDQDPPLLGLNPARDVKRIKYATDGYHTWSKAEVRQFEKHWVVGTVPRLALSLMLYLGVRKGDVVRIGPKQVDDGWIKFVPAKTSYLRAIESEKPILAYLARIIAATPTGIETFIVTSFGKKFTAKGFGGWFRARCDEAGLPHCSAHGLRKAGASICAEQGATDRQLMALFDWSTPAQATKYTEKANKKKLAGDAARLLDRGMAEADEAEVRGAANRRRVE